MLHTIAKHYTARLIGIIVALMLGASTPTSMAQDSSLRLTQTAEHDIGLDCPVTAALDPAGTTLWVLMDNCFQYDYALRAYSIADGAQVNADDYAEVLTALDGVWIDLFITPLGFTPTGDLSIRYNDPDTYASVNLLIPLASGGEVTTQTSASYDALLAEYTDYPEFSVYSPDHTRVVAFGAIGLHVIDVGAEMEIVAIPLENNAEYALAWFSADGQRLEVIYPNDPSSMDDISATLFIYNLPDGALLQRYAVPSSAVWVSPDGAYAAAQLFSSNINERSELVVIDLASGRTSTASSLLEAPAPVPTCLNNGNDVRDLGYMTSGYLGLASLHWLPDSSGVALTLSYSGEGAQGSGSSCIFNHSRLRTYQIDGGS